MLLGVIVVMPSTNQCIEARYKYIIGMLVEYRFKISILESTNISKSNEANLMKFGIYNYQYLSYNRVTFQLLALASC